MIRWGIRGLAAILVVIAVAFVAQKIFGDEAILGSVDVPAPVATIGSGEGAVGVAASGEVVAWWPLSEGEPLPQLPLSEVPKGNRLRGPALEQVKVLAAAPADLRPYLASVRFGESGVDVETTAGIELRFGDSSQLARKWKAVAAVLADPEIEALDYVNVVAPSHPAVGGSGHTLPPAP